MSPGQAILGAGAVLGGYLLLANTGVLLELVGVAAAAQLVSKNFLYAEDRKRTTKALRCAAGPPWGTSEQLRQQRVSSLLPTRVRPWVASGSKVLCRRSWIDMDKTAAQSPALPSTQRSHEQALASRNTSVQSITLTSCREFVDDKVAVKNVGQDLQKISNVLLESGEEVADSVKSKVRLAAK